MQINVEMASDGCFTILCHSCENEIGGEVASGRGLDGMALFDRARIEKEVLEHLAKNPDCLVAEKNLSPFADDCLFTITLYQGVRVRGKPKGANGTQVECPRPNCSWIGPQAKFPDHDARAHHGRGQ